ncbi:MAG TPA: RNA-binding transcriptional accessory protein, partial [Clostridiales bacterium]|nr:RNA-binding transcriptional accessory protein [Clostridiales bacterium]
MDDGVLRELGERLAALRAIEERRCEVRRLIDEQGKLTEDIEKALDAAKTVAEIDDIYRPYRPKRRTRATMAVEAGLTPLAELILEQNRNSNITAEAEKFLNPEKNINSAEDAIAGAMDIIAERVSDNAEFRKWIRDFTFNKGNLVSKAKTDQDSVYRLYYDYNEDVRKMPSHRVLAVNRGEKEDFLTVKIEVDKVAIIEFIQGQMLSHHQSPSENYIKLACEDAYDRLIAPSVQTEIRNMITATAEEQATKVFGENLKNLLLTPPIRDRVVMGFDPAYRTGCKIAVVNDVGDVLATTVVYPTPPQNRKD